MLLCAAVLPVLIAAGQEKSTEKKIKVIVNDSSGEWTVVDTILTGIDISGTLKLKDGKVIVLDGDRSAYAMISDDDGKDRIYISVAKPGEDNKDKNVIVMNKAGNSKSFSMALSTDKDEDADATKCIIAKDGIVVTVEGKDEARVKELMEEIEKKMGIEKEKESVKKVTNK